MQRGYGYNTSTGVLDTIKAGWTTVGGTPTAWFQNETVARDAVGNVTSVTDNGLEPGGAGSGVKECFLYDTNNRLVRAHSATPAAACATSTGAASVAAGSLDAYDQTWGFDDINRITARTDKLTSTTTAFAYTGNKHAVVGLSGGTTASYGYNAVGAMTSRDGTTLTYDAQQRLTSYGTAESYLYGTANQRLVRAAGTTRTLYLPGMEVTDTGGAVTVTKWLTIGGTTIGTKTTPAGGTASVAWNCGSLQNSVVCQAPANTAGTIPARKRYRPYGDERNSVTLSTTDHGFLNQPEDSTGLTYLNNRYYDPTLGQFTSVDPLVGKTGTPYLYANGNPATLSDPTGLDTCWSGSQRKSNPLCGGGGVQCRGSRCTEGQVPKTTGLVSPDEVDALVPARYRPLAKDADPLANERSQIKEMYLLWSAGPGDREMCDRLGVIGCFELNSLKNEVEGLEFDDLGDGTRGNAEKHFTLAASLAFYYGEDKAREILEAHEHIINGQLLPESVFDDNRKMDLINNERGLAAGQVSREQFYSGDDRSGDVSTFYQLSLFTPLVWLQPSTVSTRPPYESRL